MNTIFKCVLVFIGTVLFFAFTAFAQEQYNGIGTNMGKN